MKKRNIFIILLCLLFFFVSIGEAVKKSKKTVKKIKSAKQLKKKTTSKKISKKALLAKKQKKKVDQFLLQRKKQAAMLKIQEESLETRILVQTLEAVSVSVPKTPTKEAEAQKTAQMVVSPKLAFFSGDFSGVGLGLEYDITRQSGVTVALDGLYKMEGNGISWVQFGGIAKYAIPYEGQAFKPYVGGGMNYNIYMITGGLSANGVGMKIFSGADFNVVGAGTIFANVGYSSQSFNYSQTFPILGTISISANGSGIYLEAGYRLEI